MILQVKSLMCAYDILKLLLSSLITIILSIIGWIFIVPLSLLIPKNKRKMVVIGREDGKFLDNSKYFFLQSSQYLDSTYKVIFITERLDVQKALSDEGLLVQLYPSKQAIFTLLTANVVIVDSVEWYKKLKFYFLYGSKIIQLWHGVGFKYIEISKLKNEVGSKNYLLRVFFYYFRLGFRLIIGRHVQYDVVNTTSEFYLKNVFKPAFNSKLYTKFGYSRNIAKDYGNSFLLNTDAKIFHRLEGWKKNSKKIILITPTFRETQLMPMNLDQVDLEKLDIWCEKNNFVLIFKFHPSEKNTKSISGRSIFQYDSQKDIYPLFKYTSGMVVDYSSIYMDYLLMNKPIYYYVPDLDSYRKNDHEIQFDYDEMIAGHKVQNWEQLLSMLISNDVFESERAKLKKIAFDDVDQNISTKHIIYLMKDNLWLK